MQADVGFEWQINLNTLDLLTRRGNPRVFRVPTVENDLLNRWRIDNADAVRMTVDVVTPADPEGQILEQSAACESELLRATLRTSPPPRSSGLAICHFHVGQRGDIRS